MKKLDSLHKAASISALLCTSNQSFAVDCSLWTFPYHGLIAAALAYRPHAFNHLQPEPRGLGHCHLKLSKAAMSFLLYGFSRSCNTVESSLMAILRMLNPITRLLWLSEGWFAFVREGKDGAFVLWNTGWP